jgi:hypothetical protein
MTAQLHPRQASYTTSWDSIEAPALREVPLLNLARMALELSYNALPELPALLLLPIHPSDLPRRVHRAREASRRLARNARR